MFRKLLIMTLAASALAFAQARKGGGSQSEIADVAPGPPTKWETISNTLNLSRDQKKTIRSMLDEGGKEASGLRDQIHKARDAVAEAMARLDRLEMQVSAKIVASFAEAQKKNQVGLNAVFAMMHGIYRNKNWDEE